MKYGPERLTRAHRNRSLSVVVPAFNEERGIQTVLWAITAVLDGLAYHYEVLVVDDGSADATFARVAEMADKGLPVRTIRLSRRFGKEAALLAGLRNARGDAVITIDADLQHPPALIPEMVQAWERGAMIVHGRKRSRADAHWWITARARLINGVLTRICGVDLQNASDFKLLDRRAVDVLIRDLPERRRFYRGLAGWIGFPQVTLDFDVASRRQGSSRFSLRSLVALALTALLSFTSAPLRIVSIFGVLTFVLAIVIGAEALWSWTQGTAVSGFMTVVGTLLLIGSIIMISLGVIGEYIAKIYDEIKHRPPYIIDEQYESSVDGREQPVRAAREPVSGSAL